MFHTYQLMVKESFILWVVHQFERVCLLSKINKDFNIVNVFNKQIVLHYCYWENKMWHYFIDKHVVLSDVHGAMGSSEKSFMLAWWSYQVLPRPRPKFHMLANKEMKPGAVTQVSWHLTYGWRKPQLGDCLMKAVQPVTSNTVPYFQMTPVGSYTHQRGRRKEENKK